jgi:hypothetical protein
VEKIPGCEVDSMLQDPQIMKAVSRILQRSERQQDPSKLVNTFVDIGILPQLDNTNNQIIYGRRGTGKTHIFKVLAAELGQDLRKTVVYIDMRTLGSTAQFSDMTVPLKQRCISIFRDILGELCNALLDHIVEYPSAKAEQAWENLNELGKIATEPVTKYYEKIMSAKESVKVAEEVAAGAQASSLGIQATLNGRTNQSNEAENTVTYDIERDDKVIFAALHTRLTNLLQAADTELYILLDEWSSIPLDIQPFLAEFIKRGFLAIPRITIKIASLEYRSNFGMMTDAGIIGFELVGDISTALDIDDYYVYDRSPETVTGNFANMLLKHLNSELPENYLRDQQTVTTGSQLTSRMFTSRHTFEEMVRASEGIARDLINIFTGAFFDSQRRGRDSIDQRSILESARQWFEKDKSQNLDSDLRERLKRIVTEIIGNRRARSFLLERQYERHVVIQQLFDARVLHLMRRGYADKENPGVRYNIYTLDYGTYVDLMNTSKQPTLDFDNGPQDSPEFVVPFDDRRSIRRIVLSPDFLNQ